MGVDLTIMPVDYVLGERILAYSALELDRDRQLFNAIEAAGIEVDVTGPVTCYRALDADGNSCFGDVLVGPYGTILTTVSAGDLHRVMSAFAISGSSRWIFSALGAMQPEARIVMYWH